MLTLLASGVLSLAPAVRPRPMAFVERAVAAACATAPAQSTLPATIPIDLWGNHIFLKACVEGRELDFILDTGAGNTSLDLNTAKQLGVKLGPGFSVGGAGPSRVAGARVDDASVAVEGSSITQAVVSAIDLSRLPRLEGHPIDGILGYDFISRYVVAIDYARHELRIYDRPAFQYDGPGVSVPVTLINRFPHIDAEVGLADGATIRGRMVIDVGSNGSLSLTKAFVDKNRLRQRVGPTIRRTGGGGVGGATTSDIGRLASLSIGGIELSRPLVNLFGDSAGSLSVSSSWEGNIGGAILRRFTVFLDYQGKRMIFEPNATLHDAFEADMSGMLLRLNDSLTTIIVETVAEGSPASEAGVRPGDEVVSVDGVPGSQKLLGELRDRLRKPGERIALVVRRGGEEKRVELVTRRMV
ncbi:MAG TPA: aspartyl protease family protein [Gemmatimonadaceae bacterium]|nr:aspartyl protease family protein [Gemmatimonadaceae bacterium]